MTTNSISKHTYEIYFVVILHSTVEHFLFFLLFYVYSTDTLLMLKVDRSLSFLTSVQNGSCSISVVKTLWAPVQVSSTVHSETMRLPVSSGGAAGVMRCYVAGSESLFILLNWAISGLSIFWHTVRLPPCLCAFLLTQPFFLLWLWIFLHMWHEHI